MKADSGTGLAAGTLVFGAGGDGQCAGLGTNAFQDGTVYLNLGTATVTGVYSATPAIDLNWRTMTGPTGDGYFLEALQKAGAFFVNWVVDTFAGGRADVHAFDRLEAEANALPIGSDGVTMTPHIVGVMNPDWDPSARAAIVGLSSHHGRANIYRAALEALTCEIMRGIAAMGKKGLSLQRNSRDRRRCQQSPLAADAGRRHAIADRVEQDRRGVRRLAQASSRRWARAGLRITRRRQAR